MARHRKNANAGNSTGGGSDGAKKTVRHTTNGTSSSSARSQTPEKTTTGGSNKLFVMTGKMVFIGVIGLIVILVATYIGFLQTRVNSPFDSHKIVQLSEFNEPNRFWGSYRPGVYFGLKTRDPHSLVTGMMWYQPHRVQPGGGGIRHWCEIGDKLEKYGWTEHDGINFGVQEIHDGSLNMETSFVKYNVNKYGGDWTARISVKNNRPNQTDLVSLLWYAALDEKTDGQIGPTMKRNQMFGITGETSGLGDFKMSMNKIEGRLIASSYLLEIAPNLAALRDTVIQNLQLKQRQGINVFELPGEGRQLRSLPDKKIKPNFVVVQLVVQTPFTLDVSYQSLSEYTIHDEIPQPIFGEAYEEKLNAKRSMFKEKFERTFKLGEKGYSEAQTNFAKSALSNMIGGIGYFYGASRVSSKYADNVPYWKAPLYTAVPSRSFFPRGFLWDEGFHGLLITQWDLNIELDIISHWFDLMNSEGWIPREQILGVEALAKVPEEFVLQRNTVANPPTFFLTLEKILSVEIHDQIVKNRRIAVLERLYPRLQSWFKWYNTTQKGTKLGTYLWQGRNGTTIRELNPKTLASGLDDYPRASHPSDEERHIDLRCWIAYAAKVMERLSNILGHDDSKYWETFHYLSDNALLNELHLSPFTSRYSDWGLHTDAVSLKRPPPIPIGNGQYQQQEMQRVTHQAPKLRFIDSTFGYVNLFPFLLHILEPTSKQLESLLVDLRNPELIWSDYGIRSLSQSSPLYMKRNTEHDPPYWRGQIWININYLILKALHHYSTTPGPYNNEAKKIYLELRENVVRTIFNEYKRTGYLWEQYNDKTGHGSGCYPFTGWTALVVLIMSEKY